MAGHHSGRKPRKNLKIVKDERFPSMLRLKFHEGGRVPEKLSGLYSGYVDAQNAIDNYIEGYDRPKIYPKAPQNDIPQRRAKIDGKAKNTS